MKDETINKIKTSYYDKKILDKIILQTYNKETEDYREFAILDNNKVAFRNLTFKNKKYLIKTIFNKNFPFTFFNNLSNCYLSVARINKLPNFPFKRVERKKETAKFHIHKYIENVRGYDFYIDIDIDNLEDIKYLIDELNRIKEFIVLYQLKAQIVFSGSRGFKILIKNDLMKYEYIIKLIHILKEKLNLNYVDNRGSFIINKLMKCNFTIAFKPYNKFGYKLPYDYSKYDTSVRYVLPLKEYNIDFFMRRILKDNCFKIFDYPNIKLEQEFKQEKYTDWFLNKNLSDEEGKENLNNMLKDFDINLKEV